MKRPDPSDNRFSFRRSAFLGIATVAIVFGLANSRLSPCCQILGCELGYEILAIIRRYW